MKRPFAVSSIASLLQCLLPRDLGDAVVGDLAEEYGIQARSMSRSRAARWLLSQAAASLPRLLFLSIRRMSWLKSLAVAIVAYVALRLVEPRAHDALAVLFTPGVRLQLFINLCVGFAVCTCGGFLSTWVHRGSAVPLAMIGTVAVGLVAVRLSGQAPLWYVAAFLVIAPVAPIAGGAAFVARANRTRKRAPR